MEDYSLPVASRKPAALDVFDGGCPGLSPDPQQSGVWIDELTPLFPELLLLLFFYPNHHVFDGVHESGFGQSLGSNTRISFLFPV